MTDDPTSDALRKRIERADPAAHDVADDNWLNALVEETMNTAPAPVRRSNRPSWLPLAAAAAVVVIGGGVTLALSIGGNDAPPTAGSTAEPTITQAPQPTVTELTVADAGPAKCMPVSADVLAQADQALTGTAVTVGSDRVVLKVDKWFKGGDTDQVALVPAGTDGAALGGQIEFVTGQRYLLSAADGQVNSCGFSALWSEPLADTFEKAF